jgi:hypothetical protein
MGAGHYLHEVPVMRKSLVIGRMCVWCGSQKIGDIDEINILNVPEMAFEDLLIGLDKRRDEAIDSLADIDAYKFLDSVLYGDDRSLAQIQGGTSRFMKFDFLTNWGESFDGNEAFLLYSDHGLRVLFRRESEPVASRAITESGLRQAVEGFVGWVKDQRLSGDVTEAEWLASDDVGGMVGWLRQRGPALWKRGNRKFRLFNCACCRRIWSLLPEEQYRKAVEVAEEFADGLVSEDDLSVARNAAEDAVSIITKQQGSYSAEGYAAYAAIYAAYKGTSASADYNCRTAIYFHAGKDEALACRESQSQAALIRDIFGNPFHPVTLDKAWLTSAASKLAQVMYDQRDFSRMPELANVLENAGCTDAHIFAHCRQPGDHVRGCWVVDLLLGKK